LRAALPVIILASVLPLSCAGVGRLAAFPSHPVTLGDEELMGEEFGIAQHGAASFTRIDVPGPGVIFSFTGLTSSGTAVGDDYPVSNIGQVWPSHGDGDFSNFDGCALLFANLDSDGSVEVSLFIHTGFTGASGVPAGDRTNDTFWRSKWVKIAPGLSKLVVLDFNSAIPRSISDNKPPHTQCLDSVATSVNAYDRREVSNIGFQVADFSGKNPDAAILVSAVPEHKNRIAGVTRQQRNDRQGERCAASSFRHLSWTFVIDSSFGLRISSF